MLLYQHNLYHALFFLLLVLALFNYINSPLSLLQIFFLIFPRHFLSDIIRHDDTLRDIFYRYSLYHHHFHSLYAHMRELQSTNTTKKYKNSKGKNRIYTSNSRITRRQMKHFLYLPLIYWNWLTMDIHSSRVRKLPKNEKSWISYLRTLRQTAVSYYIKQKSRSVNCSFVLKVENGSPNWIRTNDLPVNSRLLYRWAIGENV